MDRKLAAQRLEDRWERTGGQQGPLGRTAPPYQDPPCHMAQSRRACR